MPKNPAEELNKAMIELYERLRHGKISEATFKRKANALLETTQKTVAQNRKVINGMLGAAKTEKDLKDSLKRLSGVRKLRL